MTLFIETASQLNTQHEQFQVGQNFFEQIPTKIRTFSEEIRTIRTIFEK